jgi:putative transposase
MLITEAFLRSLVQLYGKRIVYLDGGTWYPQAYAALGLKHRVQATFQKNLIERTIKYVKDRTEDFDDYYPCMKKECSLLHVFING